MDEDDEAKSVPGERDETRVYYFGVAGVGDGRLYHLSRRRAANGDQFYQCRNRLCRGRVRTTPQGRRPQFVTQHGPECLFEEFFVQSYGEAQRICDAAADIPARFLRQFVTQQVFRSVTFFTVSLRRPSFRGPTNYAVKIVHVHPHPLPE